MDSNPVPTFIIAGAPRSGTTYLAEALSRHPQVYMPRPLVPEPKVFLGPRQTPDVYVERYRKLYDGVNGGRLLGEKTTNYLENADVCAPMKAVIPDVKLIFILREPVARAYSNWLWSTKNGLEKLSFEDAIAQEGTRTSPLPPEKAHAKPFDYLIRGNYAELAAPYLATFGPAKIRFLLYEDITLQPRKLLQDLQEFIGVDALPYEQLDVGVVNSAREVGPPISAATEARLRERMRPIVDQLAARTGLDISPWGY